MNEVALENQIRDDLRRSFLETVIYLEGVTDPEILFALLGLPRPPDDVHQGIFVKGLSTREGSGSTAVRSRVELAERLRIPRVFGILDGDGRSLAELAADFDSPHTGPLFSWKTYSIENLVAKTGWPAAWGHEPDWPAELMKYGPYVVLNRIGLEVRAILHELGLDKYRDPIQGAPLRPREEIAVALTVGKARLLNFDVEMKYLAELASFDAVVQNSLDEAHTLINGKWLFRHMAPTLTGRDTSLCEYDWLAHARSVGGLAEVREWWERITGNLP